MGLQTDLLEIERALWSGGPEAYHRNVDQQCLAAFAEMAGIWTREELAISVAEGPRWREVEMDVAGLHQPTDDLALLTYRARARRGESEQYNALVSSAYVKRDGAWKLTFHTQTPLEP